MNLTDRVFIAMLATLCLFALFIERRNWRLGVSRDLIPPPARSWLLDRTNVPQNRHAETLIEDIGYMDVSDAANAGMEPAI
jgi:hypothetical protein